MPAWTNAVEGIRSSTTLCADRALELYVRRLTPARYHGRKLRAGMILSPGRSAVVGCDWKKDGDHGRRSHAPEGRADRGIWMRRKHSLTGQRPSAKMGCCSLKSCHGNYVRSDILRGNFGAIGRWRMAFKTKSKGITRCVSPISGTDPINT